MTTRALNGGINSTVRYISTSSNSWNSTSSIIPGDDTIPQIGEGGGYFSVAFVPSYKNSTIELTLVKTCYIPSDTLVTLAIFLDGANDSVASCFINNLSGNYVSGLLRHSFSQSTGNSITISTRYGVSGASRTVYLNGNNASRLLGGTASSYLKIWEIEN
jgi:hypothetical protein